MDKEAGLLQATRARNHKVVAAEYHLNEESRQELMALPKTVFYFHKCSLLQ